MSANESEVKRAGLLMAMMEPPAAAEEEFQQWYDNEHFPERVGTIGFLSALRAVCLEGWPRYVALYDLDDVDVLHGPEYAKIAIDNYTPWTHNVVSRVWGQYRAEGIQIYPGRAMLGANGRFSRLAIWRFRRGGAAAADDVVAGLRAIYENQPEVAQVRVFEAHEGDDVDYLGIIELRAPFTPPPGAISALGASLQFLDMVNVYTTYRRSWNNQPASAT